MYELDIIFKDMNRIDKLKVKINDPTKDFTFDEAKILMNHFNFKLTNKVRSSGSRVQFNVAMLKLIYTNHTLEILLKHIK